MTFRGEDRRQKKRVGMARLDRRAQGMGSSSDQPMGIARPPIRRLMGLGLRQMQSIGANGARQLRVIGNQKAQAPRPRDGHKLRRQQSAPAAVPGALPLLVSHVTRHPA